MKWLPWALLVLVVLMSAWWRIDLALQTPGEAVGQAYLDDAFFYVLVAENIADGDGSTLDGINDTNGYHPLWMGILVALHYFTDDMDTFFSLHLWLSALLGIGSLFLMWQVISLVAGNVWVRLSAFTLYALHPRVIYLTMNGMETSLLLFLFSFLMYLFFLWWQNRARPHWFYLLFGILSALLFLTRTDSLLILGVIFLAMLYLDRNLWFKKFTLLAAPTFSFFIIYVLFNLYFFGSPMPTNALATYVEWHYIYGVGMYPASFVELFWFIKHGAFSVINDIIDRADALSFVPSLLLALGIGTALYLSPASGARVKSNINAILIPTMGLALLFFLNSFIRYFNVDYYVVPWNILAVVFMAIVFTALLDERIRFGAFVIFLVTAIALTSFFVTYRRTYAPEVASVTRVNEAILVAEWTNDNLPHGTRIGSMRRAGVTAFFSKHVVINLDGKINNAVLEYKIDRTLYDYLKENNITYVVEQDGKLQEVYPVFASKSEVNAKSEPVYLPTKGSVGVFKVTY